MLDPATHAWIDESMRPVSGRPSYLLGGVLTDPELCAPYRTELARLRVAGVKLHWRELDARHRRRAIEVVARFDAQFLIVIASPLDHRKQERARAICFERLAWELHERGVSRAVLEARTASLMRKDDHTIDRLRSRRLISPGLRFEHRPPHTDPMLWAADLVLGAAGAALEDDVVSNHEVRHLVDAVSIVRIDL
jgi:hypothetical protein